MVFLREIKRRKVLHTLSLYVVGCWVVLQVIEVLSVAGLPPTTMRNVLVVMSVGFPLVLVVAWFLDISKEGITRTLPRSDDEELPNLNPGDHALLAGLLAVLALNAYVLSSPAPTIDGTAAQLSSSTLVVLAFADAEGVAEDSAVGDAIAEELRSDLTRIPGIKVLGPATSRALQMAGAQMDEVAAELGVTSILTGDVRLVDGNLQLQARVHDVSAGNVVWQSDFGGPVGQGPDIQARIIEAVLGAVVPTARADTPHRARVAEGECQDVYDLFLRGKQLQRAGGIVNRNKAMDLLDEAVRIDPQCGVAWEAIATVAIDWSKEGFAKSGAAARRAIEINDSLAGAWAALAEIAEEEGRWSESERTFLRALYIDPTDATVNAMYAESLIARGRVRDALHYALESYRYDPASSIANSKVAFAAGYSGEGDLVIKHSKIFAEVRQNTERYGWDGIGTGHIINGDIEMAAQIYDARVGTYVADWYPQCVRSLAEPSLRDGLAPRLWQTFRQIEDGEIRGWQMWFQGWHVVRCATWIGEVDLVVDMTSDPEMPTEAKFFSFFPYDGAALRQTEYFRNLVVESGLLDYWREWEFSDYCRPDGDSFVCD